jgi:hypothetical protein
MSRARVLSRQVRLAPVQAKVAPEALEAAVEAVEKAYAPRNPMSPKRLADGLLEALEARMISLEAWQAAMKDLQAYKKTLTDPTPGVDVPKRP